VEAFSDERIRFFRNETNLGTPRNWNLALKRASGEFIGLLNHDDLLDPFWLTFAVHVLHKYPHIGWVTTAYRIIDEVNRTLSIVSFFPSTGECKRREALLNIARFGALGPTYLARREVIEEIGLYTESAGPFADNDLFLRLTTKYPLYYSSFPHAARRDHSDRLTYRVGIANELTLALGILDRAFINDSAPEELRDCAQFFYGFYYYHVLTSMEKMLENGEIESVQRLFELLAANGYKANQERSSLYSS
jgi:glycosyltransferase involved in cell wall biosynthesis